MQNLYNAVEPILILKHKLHITFEIFINMFDRNDQPNTCISVFNSFCPWSI